MCISTYIGFTSSRLAGIERDDSRGERRAQAGPRIDLLIYVYISICRSIDL